MAITPEKLELLQIKARQLGIATDAILQSTIQFYWYNEDNQFEALGSGVLLTVEGRYFVATAAHVIKGATDNTYVVLGGHEVKLAGKWSSTKPTVIDLAVLELSDASQITDLQQAYRFLTLDDLTLRQKTLTGNYLLVGYPATKTKVYGGGVHPKPYFLQAAEANDFDLATKQLQPAAHLVLDATGLVIAASNPDPHKTPDLEGISGGGVWDTGNYLRRDPAQEKKLAGIITEEVKSGRGRQRHLLVTRTAVLLEYMRQAFALNIPASTTIKARVTQGDS
ncbi:trypsin-like peptidase domain-containing protein [Hymenobacter rigui]|uniref:Serine protease n=1 Tax=Hymenobacter rigui TaxID=334424 RepID=A0A3R9NXB8_9BACT|nr:trypsin-like peptidase domain-containing protein [Hymenobacter rigui]RSK45502.1 serine protease [Hymenobacter rigui]